MSVGTPNNPTMWPKAENGNSGYASDDSLFNEEPQVRMRVGEMYQARVATWNSDAKQPHAKEGMLIWSPCGSIESEKLESYCQVAKEKHQYNMEQALGMLFWHKHDIAKSLNDMQNFTPMPDDWSMEDKVLFEQAYAFHGKNFRKVQQLIPDKEIGQLVKFYYSWKKSRMKTSVMDKQASRRNARNDDDSDDSQPDNSSGSGDRKRTADKMNLIDREEVKHKLPKGIELNEANIQLMASNPRGAEAFLAELDSKIVTEKQKVQFVRQECGKKLSMFAPIARPAARGKPDAKSDSAANGDKVKTSSERTETADGPTTNVPTSQ